MGQLGSALYSTGGFTAHSQINPALLLGFSGEQLQEQSLHQLFT